MTHTTLHRILPAFFSALLGFHMLSVTPAAADADIIIAPKPDQALTEAFDAMDTAWKNADLTVTHAAFTDGPASGYGNYSALADSTYAPDQPIYIYLEPAGFSYREETSEDGTAFSYKLNIGYRLLNNDGLQLTGSDSISVLEDSSRNKMREVWSALRFEFSSLPAGRYILETILMDDISSKGSIVAMPFTITE